MIRAFPEGIMFLELKDIDRDGVTLERTPQTVSLAGPGDERRPVSGARITGRVVHGARGLELRARVTGNVEVACSRCLEPVGVDVDDEIFLVLEVAEGDDAPGGEREIGAEDADLYPVEGGRLDVDALLREQLDLQLPVKPLCREDCKGLCPECGADRNRTACACRREEIDPRFAPLARLKKDEGTRTT